MWNWNFNQTKSIFQIETNIIQNSRIDPKKHEQILNIYIFGFCYPRIWHCLSMLLIWSNRIVSNQFLIRVLYLEMYAILSDFCVLTDWRKIDRLDPSLSVPHRFHRGRVGERGRRLSSSQSHAPNRNGDAIQKANDKSQCIRFYWFVWKMYWHAIAIEWEVQEW